MPKAIPAWSTSKSAHVQRNSRKERYGCRKDPQLLSPSPPPTDDLRPKRKRKENSDETSIPGKEHYDEHPLTRLLGELHQRELTFAADLLRLRKPCSGEICQTEIK